jgi:ribosomal protein S12 methylthiotransferase
MRVGFISLGCPKNQLDCELMLARAVGAGYELTPRISEAEAIVINTCSFIQMAIDEADEAIREALDYKKQGGCRAVIVAGCLPQYLQEKCQALYPDVDAWLTPDQPRTLPDVLAGLFGEAGLPPALPPAAALPLPTFLASHADGRVLTTPPSLAYVKIAEGCDHRCQFCIIPQLRGRYRSRTPQDLAAEVAELVARGIPEIVLVSQDSAAYGHDLADGTNLAGLLERLCAIEGDFWLRVLYLYPTRLTPRLLQTWARLGPKLLPYFDIPLQHVSAAVLKAMGRSGDRASVDALLGRIRTACPDAVIRTTLLVGYPGETQADFAELQAWVTAGRVERLGVFAYSELAGMPSALLPAKVPEEEKQRRLAALMQAQYAVVQQQAAQLAGRELEVIVEHAERLGPGRGWLAVGRSWREAYEIDGQVRISVRQRPALYVRRRARITGAEGYDLLAVAAGE